MSRILASVSLAMLVLTMAMGLKTVVASHSDGSVMMATTPDPPPLPWRNGPDSLRAPWS
jgi:hypothetical protein